MVKGLNFLPDVKTFGDCRVWLHMMSELLAECLRVFYSLVHNRKRKCMPSLKHLDYLLLAQSLGISVKY